LAAVKDIVHGIESGKSFQCAERRPVDGETGVVKVSAVTWGEYDEAESKTCLDPDKINDALLVRRDDFLFSRANTIDLVGACVIATRVTQRVMLSDKILRFRIAPGFEKWLLWFLRSRLGRDAIERAASGNQDSMRNIGQERIREIVIPLAPASEARRVVDVTELHLSRLDETTALLERVQRNLKRYRASVLKAAVEGRLVPTEAELARAEKRDYEPASVLLRRILAERRQRWQASGRKGRYVEPEPPDTSKLPDLPEGWCWATIAQVLENRDGERIPINREDREHRHGKFPYYGASGVIDTIDDYLFDGAFLLVGEDGANLLTRSKPIAFQAHGQFWVNNHAHIFTTYCSLPLGYMEAVFNAIDLAPYVTGTAQPKLPQASMNKIPVPLPPATEQTRITESVELQLDDALRIAESVAANGRRTSRLRQSILKWAFEGKLVDQDPSDEPASVLLDRIRAGRAAEPTNGQKRRRATKSKPA
jgi:type I restriction enzyme S subunit